MIARKRRWIFTLVLVALLLALLTLGATANLSGYRFLIGGGGGPVSQGGLTLKSAVGQPVIGGGGDEISLCSGFHSGACPPGPKVFLPLITR